MAKDFKLKVGEKYNPGDLAGKLIDFGYERVETIEFPGQFSLLGGTLSIFAASAAVPLRLEFFGPELESIASFDGSTGKKISQTEEAEIAANVLILPDGSRIRPGEFIVHEDHGVGRFRCIGTKQVDRQDRAYLFLEYLNGDMLYVPPEMAEKLSSYIGVGRRKPKLSRLGSQSWQKTYKKTYENVIKLARELLDLYAAREISQRERWKIDKHWNEEIIGTFPYIDTPDQAEAVAATFGDLVKNVPMDRLISGDVGFGKTEVAIRAAAQAAANGYQVVMLVPTTILVEQHLVNFRQRFSNLPAVIEHLSRFVQSAEQQKITELLAAGRIDILIGTHRLLGKDINLKNLGLFIIDEEQRFGVKQKERLKRMRAEVNVLTLSATPIPRTLFMSLAGIRDISQINTPPGGRKAITTEITRWNEDKIRGYINREVARGGQIYYLHNEVATIEGKKIQLKKLFPGVAIEVAHGQLPEERLARVMSRFTAGQIQLLVCSTIIENGLDLSNVNTLIVEEADHFGLAQLYQIRGRIGRSARQAYALLTYGNKKITDNAVKRLKSLAENTELGSGFNIALSDLEIRGGGNILGREQHGSMEAVGLVLYSKLLKMAVDRIKKDRNHQSNSD
ncbi:MAG: DEAD/DEAH box helicase [Patescibacteria group bacterium]